MRLLMHICCANCALYPLKHTLSSGHMVTGLWFNPNIAPEDEWARRRDAVSELASMQNLPMLWHDDGRMIPEGAHGVRCAECYAARLMRTAEVAAKGGYDAFTTSLLVSPYQRHDLIAEAGRLASARYDIPFHYVDFRAGWDEGRKIGRALGLYRQNYCGCLASRKEAEQSRLLRKQDRKATRKANGGVSV